MTDLFQIKPSPRTDVDRPQMERALRLVQLRTVSVAVQTPVPATLWSDDQTQGLKERAYAINYRNM